jgi:TonB family protein
LGALEKLVSGSSKLNAFARTNITLGQSFGIAAWVVIAGVMGSWVFLQQGADEAAANLPEIPSFTLTTVQDVQEVNLIEQAQLAFAAGRIARPEADSALYFYRAMLERDPESVEALRGVDRVRSFLVNGAETALRDSDLAGARDLATQVLSIEPANRAAKSVIARIDQLEFIARLTERAVEQISAGRLTKPRDDNALATYREVLAVDPDNAVAQQGIESVAQRLATIAQTEAFAENHERAAELIALAKKIAPNARGIAETEKLTLQWSDMVKDQAVKDDLLLASQAIQKGNLVGASDASGVGALQHYQSVLKKDPQSQAAQAGVQLVIEGLVERGWQQSRSDDLSGIEETLVQARAAGAKPVDLEALEAELAYLNKRRKARSGEFDTVLSMRDLSVKRQSSPVLPRGIREGWVEVLFTVTEEGGVADVVIVDSSSVELHETTIAAVSKWRFDPFLDNGRPIPVRSGIRFTFQA